MDDLVLIPKATREEILRDARTGRPTRKTFALRHYSNACILALPPGICTDSDNVDFFMSKSGFAIQIGPEGGRAITGKKNTRTASVPIEIRKMFKNLVEGSHDLIADERADRIWFFPFSQFISA
jgi:hypothetical protein